jgi:putative colanic acid biosynthesis acetyltransferase WcaF
MIRLSEYSSQGFQRGASAAKEAAWILVKWAFFLTSLPWPSALRCALLRAFGAKVGVGVVIRGNVNITFPWRFAAGDHVWIGEEVHILSLAQVTLESNVCISQRAFLCTGSHDHGKATFDLITKPITVREGAWVAAQAFVGPGVEIGRGSRVAASAMVSKDVPPFVVVMGNPATVAKQLPAES